MRAVQISERIDTASIKGSSIVTAEAREGQKTVARTKPIKEPLKYAINLGLEFITAPLEKFCAGEY